jgi:hypothetical protein
VEALVSCRSGGSQPEKGRDRDRIAAEIFLSLRVFLRIPNTPPVRKLSTGDRSSQSTPGPTSPFTRDFGPPVSPSDVSYHESGFVHPTLPEAQVDGIGEAHSLAAYD